MLVFLLLVPVHVPVAGCAGLLQATLAGWWQVEVESGLEFVPADSPLVPAIGMTGCARYWECTEPKEPEFSELLAEGFFSTDAPLDVTAMINLRLDAALTVQEIVNCRWDDESKKPVRDPVDLPAQGESEFGETIATGRGPMPPGGAFAYDEPIVLVDSGSDVLEFHTEGAPTLARYEWNRTITWDPPEWGLEQGVVKRRSVIVFTLLDDLPADTNVHRDAPCAPSGFAEGFIRARLPAGSQLEIRRTRTLTLKRVLARSPRSLTELLQAVSELQG
jgi:hypothetical protein